MKRKTLMILSSISQIFIAIYSIVIADKIISNLLTSIESLPEGMKERVSELYSNSGSNYIIVMAIIDIILNTFILYFSFKDKLKEKKGLLIAFSIICIFTSSIEITELLCILNIIVLATIKVDKAAIKKEIPKLEREKSTKYNRFMAILLLVFYFSQIVWDKYLPNNYIGKVVMIIFYIMMIIFSILVFKDTLSRDFKAFKNNFRTYLKYIFPKLGIFYLIYLVVAVITMLIAGGVSQNQNSIEAMPIYLSLPLAIIYAPIVEEALFRGSIRRFIKNDKLFIIVSSIIFGLMHTVFGETSIFKMIILAIPYMVMGGYLAYIYVKTNNMCSNMFSHAFNNTLAMIFTILIKGI